MITNLYVKNLALIDEIEIEFSNGLNILTGETGAGKSIILGSINLALGNKATSDIIGHYGESGLVEVTFSVDDNKAKELATYDIYPENNELTISRRIMEGRSVIKINGETVSNSVVKKITALLIDIHGQHDHQSLLYKATHLEFLDRYAKNEISDIKTRLKAAYKDFKSSENKLAEFTISEEERLRNISFLQYEIDEIEAADIKDNEDIELEALYRRILNSKKITEEIDYISKNICDDNNCAGNEISRALLSLNRITEYDENLVPLYNELADIENLFNDFNRDLKSYMNEIDFDDRIFDTTEKRLDKLNGLKAKHGGSLDSVKEALIASKEKLDFYKEYEDNLKLAEEAYNNNYDKLMDLCQKLSFLRKKSAKNLEADITKALLDLNFSQVKFEIRFTQTERPSDNGFDEAEYLISLNPGEDLKPLSKIASGGELSRIMLGLKSVLAGKDDIDTLIFDEIDTGISGRTAQKVSEKMALIAKKHQVICITHLPQIASMADTHFLIEKNVMDNTTRTTIHKLNAEEIITELSRMLGGTEINGIVYDNAKEMKRQADELKKMSV